MMVPMTHATTACHSTRRSSPRCSRKVISPRPSPIVAPFVLRRIDVAGHRDQVTAVLEAHDQASAPVEVARHALEHPARAAHRHDLPPEAGPAPVALARALSAAALLELVEQRLEPVEELRR